VLVRAFEIELYRRRHFRPLGADAFEGKARVRPHVHDVGDLVVVLGFFAEELARVEREPRIDAALLDARGGRGDQLEGTRMPLSGLLVHEKRDRYTPGALTRDAPVGAALDHAGEALLAPGGCPTHARKVAQGVRAQPRLLHADEPLGCRAEDHRTLVAPAVRIAVAEDLLVHEPPALRERCDDDRVCLIDPQARDQRCPGKESSVIAHRVQHGESVPLADGEILLTVPRSGMHRARARIERHVLTEHHGDQALLEGMLEHQTLESATLELGQHRRIGQPEARKACLE